MNAKQIESFITCGVLAIGSLCYVAKCYVDNKKANNIVNKKQQVNIIRVVESQKQRTDRLVLERANQMYSDVIKEAESVLRNGA